MRTARSTRGSSPTITPTRTRRATPRASRDPSTPQAVLLEALDTPGRGHRFRLYDDDGTLYYSGIAACNAEDEGSEDVCYAPLGDFGCGYAGATEVRWDGHPEWNCG